MLYGNLSKLEAEYTDKWCVYYRGRWLWKYGPHQADMNTHVDTTLPYRRVRSSWWREEW